MRCPHARRGLVLLEMIAAVLLLSVFLLVATRLMHSCLTGMQGARHRDTATRNFDDMIHRLSQDVAAASDLQVDDAGQLTIRQRDRQLRWVPGAEGSVTRQWVSPPASVAKPGMTWRHLDGQVRFAADGPALLVSVIPAGSLSSAPADVRLVSQLRLVNGEPQ